MIETNNKEGGQRHVNMLNLWGRFSQQAKAQAKDVFIQGKKTKKRSEKRKEKGSSLFLFR